jgi:NAD(P)-dependent dehydrogenase (short-subunit alcohol dehydrogenase family)
MAGVDAAKQKVWFITGAGQGLGRAIACAALERGDLVAASSRRLADVAELSGRFGERVLPLALDVRDRAAAAPALAAAHERFGRIDVLINNAARPLSGAVEEVTEAEVRDMFDTNLLGVLWVTQAVLPHMRAQGGGHVVQISSGGGVISWPMNGVYQASKFGLDGMSEALSQEAAHLGIKVTVANVGHMSDTGFARQSKSLGPPLDAYAEPRARLAVVAGRKGNDPNDIAAKLLKVVDSPEPPLRVLLGRPIEDIRTAYESRLKTWEAWRQVTEA